MSKAITSNLAKDPKFDHEAALEKFDALHSGSQNALRRVIAFGLFCWELKELHLKHGQFGRWLAERRPHLARLDSKTGQPKASNALNSTMHITKGVLTAVGFTVAQYLEKANSLQGGICHGGEILLVADKDVPASAKALREKLCSVIDGKTKRQLTFEFAQIEEDEEGNQVKKRGREKGCKGTTKEQRQAAREREEQERIDEIEISSGEYRKWMEKHGDAKGVGLISAGEFKKLRATVEWFHGVLEQLQKQRGEGASRTGNS